MLSILFTYRMPVSIPSRQTKAFFNNPYSGGEKYEAKRRYFRKSKQNT